MEVRFMNKQQPREGLLKQEIMLQVNEQLYIQSLISKDRYEQAKIKIVEMAI